MLHTITNTHEINNTHEQYRAYRVHSGYSLIPSMYKRKSIVKHVHCL